MSVSGAVLVVDDDVDVRALVAELLTRPAPAFRTGRWRPRGDRPRRVQHRPRGGRARAGGVHRERHVAALQSLRRARWHRSSRSPATKRTCARWRFTGVSCRDAAVAGDAGRRCAGRGAGRDAAGTESRRPRGDRFVMAFGAPSVALADERDPGRRRLGGVPTRAIATRRRPGRGRGSCARSSRSAWRWRGSASGCGRRPRRGSAADRARAPVGSLLGPLGLGVDDRLHSLGSNGLSERVRVVAGVADECLAASVREKLVGGDHLVPLAGRERDVDRPRFRVDDGVELGRKTSSRAAQSIALDPPFPPDAS